MQEDRETKLHTQINRKRGRSGEEEERECERTVTSDQWSNDLLRKELSRSQVRS